MKLEKVRWEKGVVRDPKIHREVLEAFVENAHVAGMHVHDMTFSPIKGPEGNIEFLGYLGKMLPEREIDIDQLVRQAHAELDAG